MASEYASAAHEFFPMTRHAISDLLAFLAVAQERSFTRAAARLGVSQSALSHTVRALETRLGVRLLTGTTRITAIDHVVDGLLWPRLAPLLHAYPDLKVEVSSDYRMVDIVAERFDIGVRWGDQVARDMIAVRLAPDMPMHIVASPSHVARWGTPQEPADLLQHNCITLRLASSGGVYAWELGQGERQIQARVSGQATFNGAYQMLNAALTGVGLAFLPQDLVAEHLASGRLVSLMRDWCPVFPGLHAYYPSRRQSSKALRLVIEALRRPG